MRFIVLLFGCLLVSNSFTFGQELYSESLIKNYSDQLDKQSINSIAQSQNGELFFATSSGLYSADGHNAQKTIINNTNYNLNYYNINKLYFLDKNKLVLFTNDSCYLLRPNISNNTCNFITSNKYQISLNKITIGQTKNDYFALDNNNNLIKITIKQDTLNYKKIAKFDSSRVNNIYGWNNYIFLTTSKGVIVYNLLDTKKNKFILKGYNVKSVSIDAKNNLYAITHKGLIILNRVFSGNPQIKQVFEQYKSGNTIDILPDRETNLLLFTVNGVFYFNVWKPELYPISILNKAIDIALIDYSQTLIWYNKKDGLNKTFIHKFVHAQKKEYKITKNIVNSNSKKSFDIYNNTIYLYEPNNSYLKLLVSGELIHKNIEKIIIFKKDKALMAINGSKLRSYDSIVCNNDVTFIPINENSFIIKSSDSLSVFRISQNKFELHYKIKLRKQDKYLTTIAPNHFSIYETDTKFIVDYLNANNSTPEYRRLFYADVISNVLNDSYFFISRNNLYQYKKFEMPTPILSFNDKLPVSLYQDDNLLYLINNYDTSYLIKPATESIIFPKISIGKINLNDSVVYFNTESEINNKINLPNNLIANWPYNLTIYFSLFYFGNLNSNTIQYRITPYDSVWKNIPSNLNFINLNNLPQGNYNLSIRLKVNQNLYSENPCSVNFTIPQKTNLTLLVLKIAGIVLILILIAFIIFNYSLKKFKKIANRSSLNAEINDLHSSKSILESEFKKYRESSRLKHLKIKKNHRAIKAKIIHELNILNSTIEETKGEKINTSLISQRIGLVSDLVGLPNSISSYRSKAFSKHKNINILEEIRSLGALHNSSMLKNELALSIFIAPELPAQLLGPKKLIQKILFYTIQFIYDAIIVKNVKINISNVSEQINSPTLQFTYNLQKPESEHTTIPELKKHIYFLFLKKLLYFIGSHPNLTENNSTIQLTYTIDLLNNINIPESFNNPSSIKILFAEDNMSNIMIFKKLVEKYNLNITEAINGNEVIEACKKTKFDLIFIDLQMPVLDGLSAIRHICQNNLIDDGTFVVALTSDIDVNFTETLQPIGFNAISYKPYRSDEIFDIIENVSKGDKSDFKSLDNYEVIIPFQTEISLKKTIEFSLNDKQFLTNLLIEYKKAFELFLELLNNEPSKIDYNVLKKYIHEYKPMLFNLEISYLYTDIDDLITSLKHRAIKSIERKVQKLKIEIDRHKKSIETELNKQNLK